MNTLKRLRARTQFKQTVRFRIIFMIMTLLGITGIDAALNGQEKKTYPVTKNYTVYPATSKIKVDGVLNDAAWNDARVETITDFYEWSPGDGIPLLVKTECMVTFDRSNIYIAFRCFDPEPKKIRAHYMDRDSIETFIQDDHVSIMMDTFNDERRGFQFRVNPLGVQADGIFSEMEGYEDFSWDAIWKSGAKISDTGYVVEIAIPFSQLRFAKDKGSQTWGFELSRSYPRQARHRGSSFARDRNKNCLLCQFNKISGFVDISPGKNMEFAPTLTAERTDEREDFPTGELENGKAKFEPGISGRWGVTPNLMLNATINPDFSQIEADVAQLDVNNRFALRFAEKRPFFLEGADFFLTPMEAVFTRTVFDPVWGGKMTGKIGKNALGLFVTQDSYTNLVLPSNQGSSNISLEDDVFGGVFRYRRDVGKGSTVGLLYTGRTNSDYYNHLVGADGFFRLSRSKTLTVQYLHSSTKYPGSVSDAYNQQYGGFEGNAVRIRFLHSRRGGWYRFEYEDRSPNFRADFGFIPRVDVRLMSATVNPVIWGKPGQWFERLTCTLRVERITDHENNLTDQLIQLAFGYNGPLQTYIQPTLNFQKEFYAGTLYKKTVVQMYTEMKPKGGVALSFYTSAGDGVDYSNARLADTLLLNGAVELGLGKHINLNIDHLFNRLSLNGAKIFTANLFQTRLIYNFNVRAFFRATVQYTDVKRNQQLYNFPVSHRSKVLFANFLFSYKVNPQTVLFLGYTDNHLGLENIDMTRTNRAFFLKIGYALTM